MLDIYYTQFNTPLPDHVFDQYLTLLPARLKEANNKYVRWQDKQRHLFGKLLLKEGLKKKGFDDSCLTLIKYDDYKRPFVNKTVDFNISHSGDFVLCGICDNMRIGLDIEEIRPIDFSDFKNIFSDSEWSLVNSASNPLKYFYKLWVIKESIIKADSRTFLIPLKEILINEKSAIYNDDIWYLKEFHLDDNYSSCVATDKPDFKIHFHKIDF